MSKGNTHNVTPVSLRHIITVDKNGDDHSEPGEKTKFYGNHWQRSRAYRRSGKAIDEAIRLFFTSVGMRTPYLAKISLVLVWHTENRKGFMLYLAAPSNFLKLPLNAHLRTVMRSFFFRVHHICFAGSFRNSVEIL